MGFLQPFWYATVNGMMVWKGAHDFYEVERPTHWMPCPLPLEDL